MIEVESRRGCSPSRVERDDMADRIDLMGLPIDRVTEAGVIGRVLAGVHAGAGGWVATPNVDHLRIMSSRPELMAIVSLADLILADGMPLVWASKLQGTPLPGRVSGSALVFSLTEAAARAGVSIFLLGGNPGVAQKAAEMMIRSHRKLRIAGTLCPPWGFEEREAELNRICDRIREANPSLVYCCLGFPKQEFLIQRLRQVLPTCWFLGLGGSLSMVSGEIPRAPGWMRRVGLEWLWRLLKEPKRLAPRYLIHDLPFAVRLLWFSRQKRLALRETTRTLPERTTGLRAESTNAVSN